MTKHSPMFKAQSTRRALETAREECPHWDHNGFDSEYRFDCCYDVLDAQIEHRKTLSSLKVEV